MVHRKGGGEPVVIRKAVYVLAIATLLTVASISTAVATQEQERPEDVAVSAPSVLEFSTPYYTLTVPTDRASYIGFSYQEGGTAESLSVDKAPYATHGTLITLSEDPRPTAPHKTISIICLADMDRIDGPIVFADTGLITPDGLKIIVETVRGNNPEEDAGAQKLLEEAKSYVKAVEAK